MLRKRRTAHRFGEKRRTGDVLTEEKVDFSGLMLSSYVLEGLKSAGFERPSPIQLKAIPLGRCGLDLIAQAKSGTGKTCVFSVVALESTNVSIMSIQVLVLAPTREIAVQIKDVMCSIGRHMEGLHAQVFIGGTPVEQDKKCLSQCHIAIGTPGRVKHLIENKFLNTDCIRLFILDEADKLLDSNFQSQTNWIYSTLPISKQMLALSATYTDHLAQHLRNYMKDPTFVRLNATDPSLEGIRHYRLVVPFHSLPHKVFQNKMDSLLMLLSKLPFHQCLIFSNYQIRARNLSETLAKNGWPSTYISGSQGQTERLKAMEKLKEFKCRILISTDLTSRGIDAERVNLVVNMDVPRDSETYLHRVGRAGRFGSYGAAINFVTDGKEMASLNDIEAACGLLIAPLPEDVSNLLTEPDSSATMNRATTKTNVEKAVETTCRLPEQNLIDAKLGVHNERPEAVDGKQILKEENEYKNYNDDIETEFLNRIKEDEKEETIEDVGDTVGVGDEKEQQGLEAFIENASIVGNKDSEIKYAKNKGKIESIGNENHSIDHWVVKNKEGVGHEIKLVNNGNFVEHGEKKHVSKEVDANATDIGACYVLENGEKEIRSIAELSKNVAFEEKPTNDERPEKPTVGMFEGGLGNDGSHVEQEGMLSCGSGSPCVKVLTEQLNQTKNPDGAKASGTCKQLPTKPENAPGATRFITSKRSKKSQLIFRRNPTENCFLDIPRNGLLKVKGENLYCDQLSFDSFGYKESDSENSYFEESGSCSSAFEESVSENLDCIKSTSKNDDFKKQEKIDSANSVGVESSSQTSNSKESSSGNSDCQGNGSKNSDCEEIVFNNSGFKEPDVEKTVLQNFNCDTFEHEQPLCESSGSGSSSLIESGSESSCSEIFSSEESASEFSNDQLTGDPEDVPVSKKEFDVVLDTFIKASMKINPQTRNDPLNETVANPLLGLQTVAQHDVPDHYESASGFEECGRNSECCEFYGASMTDMSDYVSSLPCKWKHIWFKEYERQTNLISNYAKFYCDTM